MNGRPEKGEDQNRELRKIFSGRKFEREVQTRTFKLRIPNRAKNLPTGNLVAREQIVTVTC
jgi:hypothetical protein